MAALHAATVAHERQKRSNKARFFIHGERAKLRFGSRSPHGRRFRNVATTQYTREETASGIDIGKIAGDIG
jgi:hypothetical protein